MSQVLFQMIHFSTLASATTPSQSGTGSDSNKRGGTLHFPKFLHNWILTIRLFRAVFRTFVREVLDLCRNVVSAYCSPSRLSLQLFLNVKTVLFLTIQFSIWTQFFYTLLYAKTVLFQTIPFNASTWFNSVWLIGRAYGQITLKTHVLVQQTS